MAHPRRRTGGSPTLEIKITDEQIRNAVESNSGGCLIADAIKSQYPELNSVTVDMATIRVTDRTRGERYTYLTPPAAQHVLLSFDQGWVNPIRSLTLKRAVHVKPVYKNDTSPSSRARIAASRQHLDELQRRSDQGEELTRHERSALTRLTRTWATREEPLEPQESISKATTVQMEKGHPVVTGGKPPPQGENHPNLLRGRNRHFGAKLADPGAAFHNAVEQAVAQRLAAAEATKGT